MSSDGGHKLTVTVLGATGGCGLAFLVRALQAGHNCSACESFYSLEEKKKKFLLRALFFFLVVMLLLLLIIIILLFFLFFSCPPQRALPSFSSPPPPSPPSYPGRRQTKTI